MQKERAQKRYNKLKAMGEGTEDVIEEDEYAVTSDDSANFHGSTSVSSSSSDNLADSDLFIPTGISAASLSNSESLPISTSSEELGMLGKQSPTPDVTDGLHENELSVCCFLSVVL